LGFLDLRGKKPQQSGKDTLAGTDLVRTELTEDRGRGGKSNTWRKMILRVGGPEIDPVDRTPAEGEKLIRPKGTVRETYAENGKRMGASKTKKKSL